MVTNSHENGVQSEIIAVVNDVSEPSPLETYNGSLRVRGEFDNLQVARNLDGGPPYFSLGTGVFSAILNGAAVGAYVVSVHNNNDPFIYPYIWGEQWYLALTEINQDIPGDQSNCYANLTPAAGAAIFVNGEPFEIVLDIDRSSSPSTAQASVYVGGVLGNSTAFDCAMPMELWRVADQALPFFGQFSVNTNFSDDEYFPGPYLRSLPNPGDTGRDQIQVDYTKVELFGLPLSAPPVDDADLDGVENSADNCEFVVNPNQENDDGDSLGNVCDNCPFETNESQTDSPDGDSYGDACDADDTLAAEELEVPPTGTITRPGAPLPVSATFHNPNSFAILTVRPDCFNTTFEVRDAAANIVNPRYRIRKPYKMSLSSEDPEGDVIKLGVGESFTVNCDLSELFAPESLKAGGGGATETYKVVAHYANELRDPDCAPPRPGSTFVPDYDECIEDEDDDGQQDTPTFIGVVSSGELEIKIEGNAILPEEQIQGQGSVSATTWYAEWVGLGGELVFTIGGLPDDDVDTNTVLLNGTLAPTTATQSGTEVVATFPRSQAVESLGSLDPGEEYYPQVTGLFSPNAPSGKELFRADVKIRIAPAIAVEIDIKPGDDPPTINLGSNGNIPVAILSTPDFDASAVDPTSVTLANAGLKLKGKGTPMAALEDVNGDGLQDMVVHIDTQGLALTAGGESADLAGHTVLGTPIFGTDSVLVIE
jgi:hypothetical protein